MSTFGDVANAIAGSVGKTQGKMVLAMIHATFPEGHPEVLFAEWMIANQGRLREACVELGITPPESGPGLYQRLKDAVMPVLEQQ